MTAKPKPKSSREYLTAEANRSGVRADRSAAKVAPRKRTTTTAAAKRTTKRSPQRSPSATPDTYSAREAARVLQVSERYIRTMAASGRLEIITDTPLRVSQISVIAARKDREHRPPAAAPAPASAKSGGTLTADMLRVIVAEAVAEAIERTRPTPALMAAADPDADDRVAGLLEQVADLTAQVAVQRDRADRLQIVLADATESLAAAEAQRGNPRPPIWRRISGSS